MPSLHIDGERAVRQLTSRELSAWETLIRAIADRRRREQRDTREAA